MATARERARAAWAIRAPEAKAAVVAAEHALFLWELSKSASSRRRSFLSPAVRSWLEFCWRELVLVCCWAGAGFAHVNSVLRLVGFFAGRGGGRRRVTER